MIEIDTEIEDTHWLQESLFALYDKNEGIATAYLQKALALIENNLPSQTEDDWWRFAAVVHQLAYSPWLSTQLEKTGMDVVLTPYYVAINALAAKDSEGYLNSKAVEIREPARMIVEKIKFFL
jgi:hypothetical protein